ncbi:hypothetical protein ACFWH4_04810 [Streptomyces sp. NPDC127091]|uniref:hypothetical protein n=1 Tax=Streptomyces sp. NPDC127091 TaxID=3347134 RepID=UPI0036635F01
MYRAGEKFRLGLLAVRGARQVVKGGSEKAVSPRIDRAMGRITDRAQQRREHEARTAAPQLETAEDQLARTETALRAAKGPDKGAARRARNDAKARVHRAEATACRYR